jgi:hypothetical protein
MNWVVISQKTTFFIVTAMKTSNLTHCIPWLWGIHLAEFSIISEDVVLVYLGW